MTPEEFATRMEECRKFSGDPEICHGQADDLMLECLRSLGYGTGCDIFEDLPRWYA